MGASDNILPRGTLIAGRYRLGRPFAKGGFSVLYSAHRLSDELPVAIKLLNKQAALREDPDAAQRFEREVHSLTQLDHPHVVKTYDAGVTEDDHVFLVMERLFGTTLHKSIADAPIGPRLAMKLLHQLLGDRERVGDVQHFVL